MDPKVEFAGQNNSQNTTDLDFEDALGDALCVFKSGGVDSDLLESNEAQILFYLDLDNESIVNKDAAKLQGVQDSEDD
jgi:hypothetical protein